MRWTSSWKLVAPSVLLAAAFCAESVRGESVLNFPRFGNEAGTITGVAFVNPNGVEAPLRLTAYGTDGQLLQGPGIDNPRDLVVPANQQIARLTTELFGNGLPDPLVAWFQATSPVDGVTGFFLFLNREGTLFDGAELPPADRKIIFNQIRVDGGRATEVNIINTEDLFTRIDLFLINGDEIFELDDEGTDFEVPPKGVIRLDVGTQFGVNQLLDGAYLLVISDTNVGGFEFVRAPNGDLLGLNARGAADYLNTIYFPQLAVRGPWRMEIGLLNYSTEPVSMILTAFQPDGRPFGPGTVERNRVVRNLAGGASLRENVETLFGFTGSEPLSGWVKVESTGRAVNGYVSYGIPSAGSIAAVTALAQPRRRAIFSHLATTRGFFTGVAALNPSATAANLRIVALAASGEVLGLTDRVLPPGRRLSELITRLIPEAAGQAGGVIWVSSDVPLFLTSLFGTNTGSVLANIPPQPAPADYRPDAGQARLSVAPLFSVLGSGGGRQFTVEGADEGVDWSTALALGNLTDAGEVGPDGLYQAPDLSAGNGSITVTAQTAGLLGAATVDLLNKSPFQSGLSNPGPLAYLEGSGRLFAALEPAAGAGTLQGGAAGRSSIVEITAQGIVPVAALPGDDVAGLLPFTAFDGAEFLLASGRNSGRLVRIDPAAGEIRELMGSLNQPGELVEDLLSHSFWVADAAGVVRFSRALVESDLVSILASNGAPPERLIQAAGIAGLAVDQCNGRIYFSLPDAGEVWVHRVEDAVSFPVAESLAAPGALLALQRRDSACGASFQLLVEERSAERLVLLTPQTGEPDRLEPVIAAGEEQLSWTQTSQLSGLAFLASNNPRLGLEAVVLAERSDSSPAGTAAANAVSVVEVPELYQQDAVNPPGVPTGLFADPAFDTYNFFEGRVHDIVELTAQADGADLHISVSFADTISRCEQPEGGVGNCDENDQNPIDAVGGFIDLDVDQNPLTGLFSFADANSPYSSRIGAEFCLDFFRYSSSAGGVELYQAIDDEFRLVARVPVQFSSHGFSLSIPLSLLGDDGHVNLSAAFGTTSPELPTVGPTDAAPNGGFLQSTASGSGAAVSARAVPLSAPTAHPQVGPGKWRRVLGAAQPPR